MQYLHYFKGASQLCNILDYFLSSARCASRIREVWERLRRVKPFNNERPIADPVTEVWLMKLTIYESTFGFFGALRSNNWTGKPTYKHL